MKLKHLKINKSIFKYLLFLPFLLFTFCQSENDATPFDENEMITKDSNVVSLMQLAINGSSVDDYANKDDNNKDDSDDQCTEFLYPFTIYAYVGDNPALQTILINSDEELLAFFEELTTTNRIYIDFPVSLIDDDGVETVINNLTELEGTLQLVIDACIGDGDDNNYDDYQYCKDNKKKVYICHKGKTICVSINAIWGHLTNHEEDYLGKCDD